jgi:hypothetical protein
MTQSLLFSNEDVCMRFLAAGLQIVDIKTDKLNCNLQLKPDTKQLRNNLFRVLHYPSRQTHTLTHTHKTHTNTQNTHTYTHAVNTDIHNHTSKYTCACTKAYTHAHITEPFYAGFPKIVP